MVGKDDKNYNNPDENNLNENEDFKYENDEFGSPPEGPDAQEQYVKEGIFKKVKKVAAKVPFVLDAVGMYYCSIDQRTPMWAKGIAFGALAYFISPVDAIPDITPIVGYTDDAGAIAAAITALGSNIKDEHKDQARMAMVGEHYKKE